MTPIEREFFIEKFNLWKDYEGKEELQEGIDRILKILYESRKR